ncbi:MAG: biopolymer transporter Tol [Bacteroidetes bacterium]|nr:biopolymer transporter Tol [Bacteroidota bacterium]MBU1115799.1 biopolymer transporter Tol [Bacteroidota bacterium]MBU1800192.1 biopolymer transporter Tol [Bacteroidota bacterium]
MKFLLKYILIPFILSQSVFAQFGQNKVQYKNYDWLYIQTSHFDIYFSNEGKTNAEFAAIAAEEALADIQERLKYQINNRISLIIYNSHNEFQETNTTDGYLGQGTGGFTEPFKNRVVFPFEGDYKKYRHVIHHELVHAVMRDMLYGGTIQNIISRGITLQLPHWFHEGMAEYLSSNWETNTDMFIRNAIINDFLPDIQQLSGYFGYRGGQSVFKYIADKYGKEKVGELLIHINDVGNFEEGLKVTLGMSLEELNDKWKKDIKVHYWPDIATRQEPDEFSKRLTDNKKSAGFYNSSPAISPMGDKMAFISDRDIYLDVYVRSIKDKEEITKVVSSGTTFEFEELNVLYPALTWSPDNKQIALSLKQGGEDVITIIDVETKEYNKLPFSFRGIGSVSWSPDGSKIAFDAHNASQSDIYVYNFETRKVLKVTNDIFTDSQPSWDSKSENIYFSSDRGKYLTSFMLPKYFNLYNFNYKQIDLYKTNLITNKITRLTNWEESDEKSAIVSPDGKEILFVSDKNGIFNIYKMNTDDNLNDTNFIASNFAKPITNSLNPVEQISISKDGMKLIYTSLFKLGYNIFLINNPFNLEVELDSLALTDYMASVKKYNTGLTSEIGFLAGSSNTAKAKINDKVLFSEDEEEKDEKTRNFIFTGELVVDENDGDSDTTETTDYSKYVFSPSTEKYEQKDTTKDEKENLFAQKLDENGNYLVNKYKINFTPDLIYANAGYSTMYGLIGTTVLSFSDMLGNHRLIGITGFQVDLKNSDYGLSYYYLAGRINYGVEAFHTARFIYLDRTAGYDLFRFRNYGGSVSASFPLSKFNRFETGISGILTSSENLENFSEPMEKVFYSIPSISFVHDNTLWGYYSPIQGTRYKTTLFGNLGLDDYRKSFYSLTVDFRNYIRFMYDNSLVFRFSGGYSDGQNPQRFMLGGTDNWINRTFSTGSVPIENASDFAFLSPAMPLRGYDYAQQIGTKYMLLNLELRMPIIRYLIAGPIIPLFFQNVIGTAFVDAGTAWNNNNELNFSLKKGGEDLSKGMLIGTGFGARSYIIFFLLRFDVAWAYDTSGFSKPKYYFSIGFDF